MAETYQQVEAERDRLKTFNAELVRVMEEAVVEWNTVELTGKPLVPWEKDRRHVFKCLIAKHKEANND